MLLTKATYNKYICQKKATTIYRCQYSKDVHRAKCQALTISRLTHSLYTTKISWIRCYTKYYVLGARTYNIQERLNTLHNDKHATVIEAVFGRALLGTETEGSVVERLDVIDLQGAVTMADIAQ